MTGRRARGETLAMVLKALREHPAGLTTEQIHFETGIPSSILIVQLGNFRGAGHIDSERLKRGNRWFIDGLSSARRQLVTPEPRSIFDPRPKVAPIVSPGSSRVMARFDKGEHHVDGRDAHFVEPDDFRPGAFMEDWRRRIKTSEGA